MLVVVSDVAGGPDEPKPLDSVGPAGESCRRVSSAADHLVQYRERERAVAEDHVVERADVEGPQ